MPTYLFVNTKTGEEFEEFMSISGKAEYLKKNKHIQPLLTPVTIIGEMRSLDSRTDSTWKEVLSKISEKAPSSPLAEKYGKKKSIKEVKTQEIREKHKKRREKELKRG